MDTNSDQFVHLMGLFIGLYLVIILVALAAVIVPTWFICKKAGFSPWLSLLNIVPLGSLILLYVLAFAEWKVVPAPQMGWPQQPPLPPPYPPQPPLPPQA
jgi:hypothetical protein